MSRYAWLVGTETKQIIFLGKVVTPDSGDTYFHIGDADHVRNSEDLELTKTVLKFLAQNLGKPIQIVADEDFERLPIDESYIDIGDETGITSDDYLRGFLG